MNIPSKMFNSKRLFLIFIPLIILHVNFKTVDIEKHYANCKGINLSKFSRCFLNLIDCKLYKIKI